MTALEYAKRFPHARSQTIAHLMVKERKTPEFYTDATLNALLVAAVAKALAGFSREQADRIRESF